ncbi:hypothetical protein DH2020_039637 [Rehmannia glutinosa]|uniref:Uncharacterized protein n=1 Tax=Rehmannia glutinosa TaxID=99300 RepID=A0ABR0UX03_REHGL
MDGYFSLKLKRKDLEDVNDDFSDFSLSSPARKIRRLDAELPPIIEEEECETPIAFEHSMLHEQSFVNDSSGGIKIEELPNVPSNEEKAIVLFKPFDTTAIPQSPSSYTLSVNPHLISALKSEYQVTWSSQPNSWRPADDEAAENNNSGSGNGCLAVVPWVPSQFSSQSVAEFPSQIDTSEMMDDQEMGEEKMDVEDGIEQRSVNEAGGMSLSEGFHQWQQQHCAIPQPPPHNTSAPILKGFSEMRILYKQLLFTGYD